MNPHDEASAEEFPSCGRESHAFESGFCAWCGHSIEWVKLNQPLPESAPGAGYDADQAFLILAMDLLEQACVGGVCSCGGADRTGHMCWLCEVRFLKKRIDHQRSKPGLGPVELGRSGHIKTGVPDSGSVGASRNEPVMGAGGANEHGSVPSSAPALTADEPGAERQVPCRHLRVEEGDARGWYCKDCGGDVTSEVTGAPPEEPSAATRGICQTCRQPIYQTSDRRWIHESKSNLHGYEAHPALSAYPETGADEQADAPREQTRRSLPELAKLNDDFYQWGNSPLPDMPWEDAYSRLAKRYNEALGALDDAIVGWMEAEGTLRDAEAKAKLAAVDVSGDTVPLRDYAEVRGALTNLVLNIAWVVGQAGGPSAKASLARANEVLDAAYDPASPVTGGDDAR